MDKYIKDKLRQIKAAKTDKDIVSILDKIYEDGFTDGVGQVEK